MEHEERSSHRLAVDSASYALGHVLNLVVSPFDGRLQRHFCLEPGGYLGSLGNFGIVNHNAVQFDAIVGHAWTSVPNQGCVVVVEVEGNLRSEAYSGEVVNAGAPVPMVHRCTTASLEVDLCALFAFGGGSSSGDCAHRLLAAAMTRGDFASLQVVKDLVVVDCHNVFPIFTDCLAPVADRLGCRRR